MTKPRPGSNLEWERWGDIDPLYGVATWKGKDKHGEAPWKDEEFYRNGALDWSDFIRHWELYGVDRHSCLEIGCGAGRITMHLSGYFEATYAVDVSEGMLVYAKRHIKDPSVVFYQTDGATLPLPDRSVSAVFSTLVFRHFDSVANATSYFNEISRVLQPGGSFMINLPVYSWPTLPRMFGLMYRIVKLVGDSRAKLRRRMMELGLSRPGMRLLGYPISYLYGTLPGCGFEDIELSVFAVRSSNSPVPFVLGRRA